MGLGWFCRVGCDILVGYGVIGSTIDFGLVSLGLSFGILVRMCLCR